MSATLQSFKFCLGVGLLQGLLLMWLLLYSDWSGLGIVATGAALLLSLIHISEPTRPERISYAVFCLKKKNET